MIRTDDGPASLRRRRLIVLKALDSAGNGHVSDVIAAIEYAVAHRDELNIRVINLSIAAPVYESYETDPLTHGGAGRGRSRDRGRRGRREQRRQP